MKKIDTKTLVGLALFTALVFVLQWMGSFVRLGLFSVSLVLLPIVIGAALYGIKAGGWLGLVFGVAVLASGDANWFLSLSIPGTIITVLAKGLLCGLAAGLIYRWIATKSKTLGVFAAAFVCPVVNTAVFLLGCRVFFFDDLSQIAAGEGFGNNVWQYIIVGMVGLNFIAELVVNLILSPAVVRLVQIGQEKFKK